MSTVAPLAYQVQWEDQAKGVIQVSMAYMVSLVHQDLQEYQHSRLSLSWKRTACRIVRRPEELQLLLPGRSSFKLKSVPLDQEVLLVYLEILDSRDFLVSVENQESQDCRDQWVYAVLLVRLVQ